MTDIAKASCMIRPAAAAAAGDTDAMTRHFTLARQGETVAIKALAAGIAGASGKRFAELPRVEAGAPTLLLPGRKAI